MSKSPTTEQILFFSDAVIAITITLLMLEIRLPSEPDGLSDLALLTALGQTWPLVLGYMVSFLVIAAFWVNHHQKFHFIRRTNGRLVWLNFLFLLVIGLIPFATGVISHNGGSTGTALYAGLMALCALTLNGLWAYACAAGLTDLPRRDRWRKAVPMLLVAAVFALSIPVALRWPDGAKYSWLLLIPLSIMRRFHRDAPAGAEKAD